MMIVFANGNYTGVFLAELLELGLAIHLSRCEEINAAVNYIGRGDLRIWLGLNHEEIRLLRLIVVKDV